MSKHNKAWRHRNPEKARAHARVNWAVRTGKLVRQPCEKCGHLVSEAHHADYSRPLDVEWLCNACHETAHHGTENERRDRLREKYRIRHAETYVPRPRKSRRIELCEEAKQLRDSGLSYSAVGASLGMSKSQAFKVVNSTPYK